MLRSRTIGRRFWLAVATAALIAMTYAGVSLAASDTIVAEPTDSYSAPTYNADQGSLVPFQNNGGSHNVTARQKGPDGNDLFRSETTTSGTTPVNGTQYLTTGAYPFFCTVHPTTMQGTLQVTGAGTPQARPSATLAVKGKSLAKAIKKGIKLTATASTRTDAEFTARLGKTLIGQKRVSLATGAQSVLVKLSKAGKSKLRAKGKATVKVTAEIPFGSPVTAKAKLK